MSGTAWKRLINQPDRQEAFRAFETATLWGIRKGLRNGSLYLTYAREYWGKERLLPPAITWSEQRKAFCERRQLPEDQSLLLPASWIRSVSDCGFDQDVGASEVNRVHAL
jgi:hypothetical protein